jgi:hypothetical protein
MQEIHPPAALSSIRIAGSARPHEEDFVKRARVYGWEGDLTDRT